MKKLNRLTSVVSFVLPLVVSCKKNIEVPPPANMISSENVFTNDQTSISVLTGFYSDLGKGSVNQGYFAGSYGLNLVLGLSADELTSYNAPGEKLTAYYTNSLADPGYGSEYWSPLYNFVFRCNAAIEGLDNPAANALTPAVRRQLSGEAKFMRAFFYFYLVNLYGDVPLAVTTDYKTNILLNRSPQEKVYKQIIDDLKEAKELLSKNYLDVTLSELTTERVRPTYWAASALLARAYLYSTDYTNAELEASITIDHREQFDLPELNNVFLKNSLETIWQVQPTTPFFNTEDARTFVIPSTGPFNLDNPVYLSNRFLSEFEAGDQRKKIGNWVGEIDVLGTTYYYPNKYKDNLYNANVTGPEAAAFMTEYQMILRLAEQYLIRAEARIHLGKVVEGIDDINKLRIRATDISLPEGDPERLPQLSSGLDQNNALRAVDQERKAELFTESGHRWFDLKRRGNIDSVMEIITPIKSGGMRQWQSYQQFFPIPTSDINKAPNLTQTPGY
ncbi:MAG: RagB/SusD family nutrient uptake outer membrane protein [Chitinophagaceae bacterium]|nr:RagB/SusD family nutrient uptake outer membrane protein [Chitinophagaceae bacterium]